MFNNAFEGKKVLVTGHTGFKGTWMTIWLQQMGAEVVGISDKIPTDPVGKKDVTPTFDTTPQTSNHEKQITCN